MEDITSWITPTLFVATVVGWAMKYGSDQQAQKSKNEMQDMEIDALKRNFQAEKEHNAMQHREFYDYGKETIAIKSDIKHIMSTLDEIKIILGSRASQR
jgi:hypothetical protein